jgi:hypothetical protein
MGRADFGIQDGILLHLHGPMKHSFDFNAHQFRNKLVLSDHERGSLTTEPDSEDVGSSRIG